MRRIVIANQKGGVAKTTTSINLAAEIARQGNKVLLIDMDPQNSATSAVFGNSDFEHTIYDVLVKNVPIEDAIQYSPDFAIDVIPSDIGLSGASMRISQQLGREKVLFHCLAYLKYDYLIVDAPPSLGLLAINALTACNELIIPISPEFFSLKGILIFGEIVKKVREGLDSEIDILGVVITRFRQRVVTESAKNAIVDYFGDKVFETIIPENIKVEEAHNMHLPVYKHDKTSKGAIAYASLAQEVINGKIKNRVSEEKQVIYN